MTRLTHSFSVEHAELYGIDCAILIHHMQFWIEQNQSLGRNFYEGRTWMYQTQKEIAACYPYWSEDAVYRLLKKLEEKEVLIKGNFNKTNFDRTVWYAFKNEKMFTVPRNRGMDAANPRNPKRESAVPIPDTNPNAEQKQQQQPAAAPLQKTGMKPPVYVFLKNIEILEEDKIEITERHPENVARDALEFTEANKSKIKTTYVAYLKMACAKGLKLEKTQQQANPKEADDQQSAMNRESAKKFIKDHWNEESVKYNVSDRVDHIRIGNDSLYYKDLKFKDLFDHYIKKLR
jgi:hypothetical protein